VYASGIWESYKGRDIVRVLNDGDPIKTVDVPAINYDNRTLIPLSLLSELGLVYSWDNTNKTVNVTNSFNYSNQVVQQDQSSDLQYVQFLFDIYDLFSEIQHHNEELSKVSVLLVASLSVLSNTSGGANLQNIDINQLRRDDINTRIVKHLKGLGESNINTENMENLKISINSFYSKLNTSKTKLDVYSVSKSQNLYTEIVSEFGEINSVYTEIKSIVNAEKEYYHNLIISK